MTGDLLLLLGPEGALAQAVQTTLQQRLGARLPQFGFDQVRTEFWGRRGALLVVLVQEARDLELANQLGQEMAVQDIPLEFVLVETRSQAVINPGGLPDLPVRRIRWPQEANGLVSLLRPWLARGAQGAELIQETVHDRIARTLLHFTPSLRPLVETVALAAAHDVPVLISGETGTGKTHLARLLHDCSPRQQHRFLVVSCGALTSTLIESELFGHIKGAFTSADQPKEGKFAAAGQGTLLLDEIDALSLEQQANLLRVLETGEYEPVGSTQTMHSQARIIAASNRNLELAVACGEFRRDLYYRLHVLNFHLPPLRDRLLDLAPLTRSFVARYNTKFRKGLRTISPDTFAALEAFDWPGNIRQLENVVQQAVLVSTGPVLLRSFLPQTIQHALAVGTPAAGNSLEHNRQDVERALIRRALVRADNSRTRAARALGISRVTLYKKMRQYGLLDPAAEPTLA